MEISTLFSTSCIANRYGQLLYSVLKIKLTGHFNTKSPIVSFESDLFCLLETGWPSWADHFLRSRIIIIIMRSLIIIRIIMRSLIIIIIIMSSLIILIIMKRLIITK